MSEISFIRQKLHSIPELSREEYQTSMYIGDSLSSLGFAVTHGFSDQSVLGVLDFQSKGPVVVFRAELDALPIALSENFTDDSVHARAAHLCGHDGHMAVMLGLARWLNENPFSAGKIILLFQSAEETGEGAARIIDSDILSQFNPDYIFAWHNIPGFELGRVIYRIGFFSANVESISISLKGVACHAAEPEKGVNPALAIADLILYFNSLQQPDQQLEKYFLATLVNACMGTHGFGSSAANASISYTFRAWDLNYFAHCKSAIELRLQKLSDYFPGMSVEWKWSEAFAACMNNESAVSLVRTAADEIGLWVTQKKLPFTWGEDFGQFTAKYKGAMFGLGAGIDCCPLHHKDYEFPNDLLPLAVDLLAEICKKVFSKY